MNFEEFPCVKLFLENSPRKCSSPRKILRMENIPHRNAPPPEKILYVFRKQILYVNYLTYSPVSKGCEGSVPRGIGI